MKSILLVEDDMRLASHWQAVLEAHDFRVVHETSVEGAIDALDELTVDLVITDIVLESEDHQLGLSGGLAVISYIALNLNPQPKIIATSGDSGSPFVDRNFGRLQALRRLRKPVSDEDLIQAVNGLLSQQSSTSSVDKSEIQHALHSRLLLDVLGANDGIWDWQIGTEDVEYSAAWRRMLGFDSDDLDGFPNTLDAGADRVHPDDRDTLWASVNEAIGGVGWYNVEFRMKTKSGEYIWVESRGRVGFDSGGAATRLIGITHNISDRKNAQRQSDALKRIIDNSLNEVYIFEAKSLKFSYANRGALNNIGYTFDEMLKLTPVDIKPEIGQTPFEHMIQPLKDGKQEKMVFETVHRRKDGSRYDVEVHLQMTDYLGRPCFVATVLDITSRKRDERELLLARSAIDNSGDAVYMANEQGRFIYVNETACTRLDYTPDELLSMTVPDVDPNVPSCEFYEKELAPKIQVEKNLLIQNTHRRKDGSTFPVEVAATYIQHAGESIFCANVRDVTERQRLLSEIRQSAERFNWAMQNANIGVWEWAPETDEVYFDDVCKTQLGYPIDEPWSMFSDGVSLVHDEDLQQAADLRSSLLAEPQNTCEKKFRLKTATGEYRWIRSIGRGVFIEEKLSGIVGVHIDIHDEASAREEIEQTNQKLQQTNAELEQFAYVASHDLKQPLRGISHLATWIDEDCGETLPTESKENLHRIMSRAERLDGLLDDLLAYSRVGRERSSQVVVDTGELVSSIKDLLAPPSNIVIDTRAPMPVLMTELAPLKQVLMNLIGNAIKHSAGQKGRIEVNAQVRSGETEFAVCDDGPGIAPEYHDRIFRMFHTLQSRDKVEGSGMGLALVKKLIESRGGKITVDSELGKGAKFVFSWPGEVLEDDA